MGVHTLTSFLEIVDDKCSQKNIKTGLPPVSIPTTFMYDEGVEEKPSFVIDYSAFVHHFAHSVQEKCKSQGHLYHLHYGSRAISKKLLDVLMKLKRISSHITLVFDGVSPEGKSETGLERGRKHAQENSKVVTEMLEGKCADNVRYFPLISSTVAKHIALTLECFHSESFSLHFAKGEGDLDAAKVAKETKSIVITNDTDFLMFPLEGVVFLKHITFEDESVSMRVYKAQLLSEFLELEMELLPIFSCMAGNDHTVSFKPTYVDGKFASEGLADEMIKRFSVCLFGGGCTNKKCVKQHKYPINRKFYWNELFILKPMSKAFKAEKFLGICNFLNHTFKDERGNINISLERLEKEMKRWTPFKINGDVLQRCLGEVASGLQQYNMENNNTEDQWRAVEKTHSVFLSRWVYPERNFVQQRATERNFITNSTFGEILIRGEITLPHLMLTYEGPHHECVWDDVLLRKIRDLAYRLVVDWGCVESECYEELHHKEIKELYHLAKETRTRQIETGPDTFSLTEEYITYPPDGYHEIAAILCCKESDLDNCLFNTILSNSQSANLELRKIESPNLQLKALAMCLFQQVAKNTKKGLKPEELREFATATCYITPNTVVAKEGTDESDEFVVEGNEAPEKRRVELVSIWQATIYSLRLLCASLDPCNGIIPKPTTTTIRNQFMELSCFLDIPAVYHCFNNNDIGMDEDIANDVIKIMEMCHLCDLG
eukprot:m.118731 g.118731  ORF g.118731 m.118731 type:complete len:718 (-) comp14288_c0_seq4:1-2154(-)